MKIDIFETIEYRLLDMADESSNQTPEHSVPGSYLNSPKSTATFQAFAVAIQSDDLEQAGTLLSGLTGITADKGLMAASFFSNAAKNDSSIYMETMAIRTDIDSGNFNNAKVKIMKCFGLDGLDSLQAFESLRKML